LVTIRWRQLIKHWVDEGWLVSADIPNERRGGTRKVIRVGEWVELDDQDEAPGD
jgi:hypothetical protein